MLTINNIKSQLKQIDLELSNSNSLPVRRIGELLTVKTMLQGELIKLLETNLNKKELVHNFKRVG